ncbi:protein kinase [Amycolatopsis sp. QT-25]|uniref:protein kinase n=1 Tax=Amycolatopsis sp. QT-25 TaxID=3034022 RepID=UPI0023EB51A3|nr:protein kinase [Amycolatopsis sp. QT-25]WET82418.1 protein kinase [Amycolatopsis sp. QT-25]
MRPEDGEALGGGSAGDVFALGPVALKVFPGRLDDRTRLLVERELERLSSLDGQFLVPDAIEDLPGGRCALRSELCTGSLLQLVGSAGRLPVSDTLVLGSALASTLATAHESGVVHGRLTPANVLFRASGEPVVNDFEHTLRPVFIRDPQHGSHLLAPERAATESADLHGLGVVLYLALTGVLPRPDRPPLHREDAPIDLLALIENLLADDPAARPPGAALVAEVLAGLVDEHSAAERPPVAVPPMIVANARPRKSVRPVLAIGTASVLAVAGWLLLPGLTDQTPPALARPAPHSVPPRAVSEPASRVELVPPIDRGSVVELSWRAPHGMDSAVVVTSETGEARTTLVRRLRTANVPVEPGRKYCFVVQVTDGRGIAESAAYPIRGAVCRK